MSAKDLVGEQVVMQNPTIHHARWEGRAIAYVDSPSLVIELLDGRRVVLPAEWAQTLPTPPDSRSTEG